MKLYCESSPLSLCLLILKFAWGRIVSVFFVSLALGSHGAVYGSAIGYVLDGDASDRYYLTGNEACEAAIAPAQLRSNETIPVPYKVIFLRGWMSGSSICEFLFAKYNPYQWTYYGGTNTECYSGKTCRPIKYSCTGQHCRCLAGQTRNENGVCEEQGEKGPPANDCGIAGNPINIANGNKYQDEVDFIDKDLKFSRHYNSLDGLWRNNFSARMIVSKPGEMKVITQNGREAVFVVSDGLYIQQSGRPESLARQGGGVSSKYYYSSQDGMIYIFNYLGILLSIENIITGVKQSLTYANNDVTVTGSNGASLKFSFDGLGQPISLSTPAVKVAYVYNKNSTLNHVSYTRGALVTRREYHYEDSRNPLLLTGITDERGIRYATWRYDDKGRAISSEHASDADKTTISYDGTDTVSVTNALGKVTKYTFQTVLGVRRVASIQGEPSTNCPNSNSSFAYDARGLVKSKIDKKGNLTTYDYNTRGLEVSRTEAAGTAQARTITTDWHPTLFLPLTVTEPTRITTFIYDTQGRQLSQSVTQH